MRMIKVVMVVPEDAEQDVMAFASSIGKEREIRVPLSIDLFVPEKPAPARAAKATAPAVSVAGRNKVVYRMTDQGKGVQLSGRREEVRVFIVSHPDLSAREIWEGTKLGQKAVESAIHSLRTSKIIEAVPVS